MSRILIVANRLPVSIVKSKGGISLTGSVGGLATGVRAAAEDRDTLWIGWAEVPAARVSPAERAEIVRRLRDEHDCEPIFLGQRDVAGFYHGFSNRTIWPLFHYFARYAEFDPDFWSAYVRVNRIYRDAILEVYEPGDTVWVHDYQLMLVPQMLRDELPGAEIGFFLHIPFPSYELFRMMPWRREVLEGLLGADLVGFHTFDYVRHFLSSCRAILGTDDRLGMLEIGGRLVVADAFPMGIDVDRYAEAPTHRAAKRECRRLKPEQSDRRLIVSVDRLDYTKGIPDRLCAYDAFLEKNPKWRGKVRMVCVAVPSRTRVERYRRLKAEVDGLVGSINGRWGTVDWTPVTYLYRALPFHALSGLYSAGDVALVTPLRDGMNLVAKEYVAARNGQTGVLILSEMAGAARELTEALTVNPFDQDAVVAAIGEALAMSEGEQVHRNELMLQRLRRYDVYRWTQDFLGRLDEVGASQRALAERLLVDEARHRLTAQARESKERVVVLDYDGTLVPFAHRPEDAKPGGALVALLRRLIDAPGTFVAIASGRSRDSLDEWFGELPIALVAEHGAWIREPGDEWVASAPLDDSWKQVIRPIMDGVTDVTPGSHVEEKDFSLAWHYRDVQGDQAANRLARLTEHLAPVAADAGLVLLEGNRVLEVKMAGIDKGSAAYRWMARPGAGFVLVAGDDRTDEALFEAAPESAWTIRVGRGSTRAAFTLPSWRQMRALLDDIAEVL